MKPSRHAGSEPAFVLVQPEVSCSIRELRHLTLPTQVQLAGALRVAYETINRWENERIQPLPLALRQIRALIAELDQFPSAVVREGSQQLLAQYFLEGRAYE